jgi:hypothetical protein
MRNKGMPEQWMNFTISHDSKILLLKGLASKATAVLFTIIARTMRDNGRQWDEANSTHQIFFPIEML